MLPSRSALKQVYARAKGLLGRDPALIARLRAGKAPVVLHVHEVSPEPRPSRAPVTPHDFDEFLSMLTREAHVTSLRAHQAGERPRGNKPAVVLSFDGGDATFIEHAMPVLRKHGVVANLNVLGEAVETGLAPWSTRFDDFLDWADTSLVNELRIPGFPERLAGPSFEEKVRFCGALTRFLRLRPRAERGPLRRRVEEVMDRNGFVATSRALDVAAVVEIAKHHEVGALGYRDEAMGHETTDVFAADLERCEVLFRERLRLPFDIYAFSDGSFRGELLDVARARGIQHLLIAAGELDGDAGAGVHARLDLGPESAGDAKLHAFGWKSQGAQ